MWRWAIACAWLGIVSGAWAQSEAWVTTLAGKGAPGAFPASVAVFANAPLPHQIADAFEPDNQPDQAVLLGREPQARTFHTPGDVDWVAVPVRPGYAVQMIAEGDTPVRAVMGDETFDLPGDLFPPASGADTVRVALSHGAGGVGAYVLRGVERRTAQLSLQAPPSALVEDGTLEVNVVLLEGQIAEDGGLLGRIRFHAANAEPRRIAIVSGRYGLPSGIFPFGIGGATGQVQVRADTFEQWLYFQQAFGAVKGDIRYQAIWDIDGDGVIGFGDFLKWLGQ